MGNMKECFKCGEVKPLAAFYKHSQMKDGHLNKCKECTKADVHANRSDNIDYYREYDRKRGSRQSKEDIRSYRKRNPVKWAAHIMVNNKVANGTLVKPDNCVECGSSEFRLHGHHDDYAKPLEVRWLCPLCHHKWHKENGEGKNGN
jgi:hypothetical protein